MRLTTELIRQAHEYINPIKEREISLRGLKIPAIENLGVTQDQYETIDLCENELISVDNFPLLTRLQSLLLSHNRIARIAAGLGKYLPALTNITLIKNKISDLESLDPLRDLPKLTHVSLIGNPVTKRDDYRLYLIHKLPNLKVLDFKKVKPVERKLAKEKFGELEELEDTAIEEEKTEKKQKTKEIVGRVGMEPTQKQRKEIMELIKKAQSLEEITRLENLLMQMTGSGDMGDGDDEEEDVEMAPRKEHAMQNGALNEKPKREVGNNV